ncbi:MAG: acetolactate synthase small subunit [Opitutales bacterium]|nr:acetolactate synthase small subunit [Opitutales bacterium]
MRHTISVLVENKFGVLTRVTGLFSGRGFNIDTLNVGPTSDPRFSRITATVRGNDQQLDQCIKQLGKLVEVIKVQDLASGQFVARELAIVKVRADSAHRGEIVQLCDIFRAKIVDVSLDDLIIEMTGNDEKVGAFLSMMEQFGILSLVRTGALAMERTGTGSQQNNNSEQK